MAVALQTSLPDGTGLLVPVLFKLVPAVMLASFVRVSAVDAGDDHARAWPIATFLAGFTDAFAIGSWVVVALYLLVRDPDRDGPGRIRRWLVHRGRDR